MWDKEYLLREPGLSSFFGCQELGDRQVISLSKEWRLAQ